MSFQHGYPYGDVHELNLDWIMQTMQEFINSEREAGHTPTVSSVRSFFTHKYPYGDIHELNLDWVIQTALRMEEIGDSVDGDIGELKTRMTTAEGNISALENTVGGLSDSVNQIETVIEDIQGDVEDLQATAAQHTTQIAALDAKIDAQVVANPTGTPTDTLETIGIGGTIYAVDGSEPVSKTVTGNPISITDAADAPIVSGEVTFEPVQDLHGYDKPWAGGNGKNKFGGTLGEIFDFPAIIPAQTAIAISFARTNQDQGNAVTVNLYTSGSETRYDWYTISENSRSVTLTQDTARILFYGDVDITNIQVEISSTVTSYEPYSNVCPIEGYTDCEVEVTGNDVWTGNDTYTRASTGYIIPSTTISLPIGTYAFEFDCSNPSGLMQFEVFKNNSQQGADRIYNSDGFTVSTHNMAKFTINEAGTNLRLYTNNSSGASISNVRLYSTVDSYTLDLDGTRYGGTVDLVSGEMRVDKAIVDLGTLTWSYNGTVFSSNISDITLASTRLKGICSHYPVFDGTVGNAPDGSLIFNNTNTALYIKDSRYNDVNTFKTAMSGVQLCYELATPFTVQLTPEQIRTLQGTNNISTNMTSMSVEYITQEYQSLVELIERSAGHHYSTDEHVIGTWIDGKPLYEKSFQVITPSNNSSTNLVEVTDLNIDYMKHIEGTVKNITSDNVGATTASGDFILWLRYNYENTGKAYIATQVKYSGYYNQTMYITIQYTKTTD